MILVWVETDSDGVTEMSRETLAFSRHLAQMLEGPPVEAVLVGELTTGMLRQLAAQGVHRVHQAGDDRLDRYAAAGWAAAVVDAAGSTDARMVLAAGSPRGNEILAHVAARLGVAMAANVVAVETTSPLVVSRQVLGAAALEEMRLDDAVAVMSVAGHAVEPVDSAQPSAPDVVPFSPGLEERDLVVQVIRTEREERGSADSLRTARVVVGAGRGAGGPDGFADVVELTGLLGGSLGVSRVVTSLGWRPHHEQVGQTGTRISPDLYIPCGISGAIQHWAGCSSARTILAVNSDPEAPLVTMAHYAVVGDMHEVVPAINAEIRRRRGEG